MVIGDNGEGRMPTPIARRRGYSRRMRTSAPASLAAVGIACSSSNSNGNGATAPVCSKNTVQLSGTLDGASANGFVRGPSSYAFANALGRQPGTFDVSFGSG